MTLSLMRIAALVLCTSLVLAEETEPASQPATPNARPTSTESVLDRCRREFLVAKADMQAARARFELATIRYQTEIAARREATAPYLIRPHQEVLDEQSEPTLRVVSAKYGAGNRKIDVTEKVRSLLEAGKAARADSRVLGISDPADGVLKTLVIRAQVKGVEVEFSAADGSEIKLDTKGK